MPTIPTASPTPLPLSECTFSRSWLPMIGSSASVELTSLGLQVGDPLQHEAEDRHQQEQQREQRQEPVVGDQRSQVGALVVAELVDHGDGEAQPAMTALVGVY